MQAKHATGSRAGRPILDVEVLCDADSDSSAAAWTGTALEQVALKTFTEACDRGWAVDYLTRASGCSDAQLCIRLVDANEGEALNQAWRNKPAPTNVLSFPADIVASPLAPLGDLVLCVPVVEREAREQGKSLSAHVSHLVVHGVLHLLGYDHVEEEEAETMEAMEVVTLGELGIGNPYE